MDNLLLPSGLLKKLQVTESKDWYILLDTTCTFSSLPFLYERVDNDDTIKKKKSTQGDSHRNVLAAERNCNLGI